MAILQGFAKHRGRGGRREAGLRQQEKNSCMLGCPFASTIYRGRGRGCAPSRVPSLGVAAALDPI